MKKYRKIKLIALVLFLLAITGVAINLFMQSRKPEVSQATPVDATAEHDATNSDNHHSASPATPAPSNTIKGEDLTSQKTVSLDIVNFKYSKQDITVKKGTTVTWTNRDTMEHNVMKEHADGQKAHDAPKKSEVKPDELASQLLAKGESYSFTFNEAGDNAYHCSPHPYMVGSVTVVE